MLELENPEEKYHLFTLKIIFFMKAPKDQHFLIDTDAVDFIADSVPIQGMTVLEVGPGGGVLTAALLERGSKRQSRRTGRNTSAEP